MSEDQLYENIPTDPEQAFLYLEKYYRFERDENIVQLNRAHEPERSAYVTYLTKMNAAIAELGLESELSFGLPHVRDIDFETYQNLLYNINTYLTKLKIRHGRRVQGYSVRFDAATKQKIRHHLTQVRGIVDNLEVDQKKKETLFEKISALEQEVDRDRTRFDIYGAFVIEVAGVIGDATEKVEPLRKWVDSISRLIWGTKEEEEAKQLPSPPERKQIEPPRPEDAFGDFGEGDENNPPDSEDKVPF